LDDDVGGVYFVDDYDLGWFVAVVDDLVCVGVVDWECD